MPIRLIHGMNDNDVPWKTAHNITDSIEGDDVEVQFIKGGDHRLSSAADLNLFRYTSGNLKWIVQAQPSPLFPKT